eukprot:TRINITY_DN1711_c0_g1_i1.p1 TRINITY_DN1711_c0_g1~~TRINITY_DN1711_c0_g1_i1.p1  ORF type:complete len:335 (-),score=56.20 TRINITY_DN1711_c0_g1_i1:11-988(-)
MTDNNKNTILTDFLEKTNLIQVLQQKGKRIIEVTSSTPLAKAIQILAENSILSVPVRDSEDGQYLGFLDVMDIVTYVLQTYSEDQDKETMQWSTWCKDIDTLEHRGVRLGLTPVQKLIDSSGCNRWCPVQSNATLAQVISEIFAQGIHRAPVVDENNVVHGLISQSDVIGLIFLNFVDREDSFLGELGLKTVQELKLGSRETPVSMVVTAQAIQAFWLLYYNKVSAIAITDKEGKLVANLSASDIEGVGSNNKKFSTLLLPLQEFFSTHKIGTPPITCTLNSTLKSVLVSVLKASVHRVWIVDNDKPIGLISLTDLMKLFASLVK